MEWHFLPWNFSPLSPSETFADIPAPAVRSVSESGCCLWQWGCRSPQSGLSHDKMSVLRPVELVLHKGWINFYCISINHCFAVATLTTPGGCCWCGVTPGRAQSWFEEMTLLAHPSCTGTGAHTLYRRGYLF